MRSVGCGLGMLWLWAMSGGAAACEEDLKVREYLPLDGSTGVPVDSRVVIAFIGMGSLEDFDVSLYNAASGRKVGVDRDGWCYTHEGPNELHCWARMTPRQEMEAWTTYEMRVQKLQEDTGEEPEPLQYGSFITGERTGAGPVEALGLEVTDSWQMDPSELDSCDWDEVSRWWLQVDPRVDDATGLELFHFYELDEAGAVTTEDPIHTVFSPRNLQLQEIKQYLDGAKPHSNCFGVVREGPTGTMGVMTTDCYDDDPEDSGGPDDPKGKDSDASSSDTAPESGEGDSAIVDGAVEPVYPVRSCRCSSTGGWGALSAWSVLCLIGWGLRRRD